MFSTEKVLRAVLRSSILWGSILSIACYFGLPYLKDRINPVVWRYIDGGWVAYSCIAMFLVGLSALVIKAVDLTQGWIVFYRLNVSAIAGGESALATIKAILRQLDGQPALYKSTFIWRRMHDAFDYVVRKTGSESLDTHLRYLADIDAARMNTSYGIPRFLCWAIPTVGSLGTVLGIGLAISSLSILTPAPDAQGASAAAQVLTGATASLALAFDSIVLALALSIILMLLKFTCEQIESHLLDAVEEQTDRELTQRTAALTLARSAQPADQMRFVADRLGELTEKIAASQSFNGGSVVQPAGLSSEQLESIVSRAVAKVSTGQPSFAIAGGGQLNDMSQVQEALKQIAAFFSIQQAEHQQEGEIVKQLSEIIREGNTNWKPRRQTDSASGSGSLVGLWNSLNDD
jgi:hypothetical protein